MRTTQLKPQDAPTLAALHIQGIKSGFISSLGLGFVTALYEAVAKSSSSFGFAVEDDERVVGFVTFTSNISKLYKSVIVSRGLLMAGLLAGRVLSLQRIKKTLETLFYPKRVREEETASAELLSIVVREDKRNQGLGTELVIKSLQRCRQLGLEKVKVLVAADNEPANKLYQKCGFKLVRRTKNHDVLSNIYEAQVAEALNNYLNNASAEHSKSPDACEREYPFKQRQVTRVA
jgi:ribosomal protein S18 acetylase RimI-like enzyme